MDVVLVRRGLPDGSKYCTCDQAGNPIRGFDRLGDVRKFYRQAIQRGEIELRRELYKRPDLAAVKEISREIDEILRKR